MKRSKPCQHFRRIKTRKGIKMIVVNRGQPKRFKRKMASYDNLHEFVMAQNNLEIHKRNKEDSLDKAKKSRIMDEGGVKKALDGALDSGMYFGYRKALKDLNLLPEQNPRISKRKNYGWQPIPLSEKEVLRKYKLSKRELDKMEETPIHRLSEKEFEILQEKGNFNSFPYIFGRKRSK